MMLSTLIARWTLLGLMCSSLNALAQELSIETSEQHEAFTVNATAIMPVRLATAWSVISDYDHLADFVPGMHSSRVLERSGNQVLLEQTGSLGFLFFQQPIAVKLAVTESPPERIVAHAVGGNLKQMDGRYTLEAMPDGKVRLSYSASLRPDFAVPPVIGRLAVRQVLARQFKALVQEIQRRDAMHLPLVTEEVQKQ
ncbi:MAG: SRPBCC family protein [Comamonas sp.]